MPRPVTQFGKPPGQITVPIFNFDEIEAPGAFLEVETGRLFRVQPGALQPGHSPMITITSNQGWRYAKLSDDPNVPISKARVFAADADLTTSF